MLKKWVYFFSIIFMFSICFADGVSNAPLNIEETDSSPSTFPYKLIVSNGSLTDNSNGTASLNFLNGIGGPYTAGSVIFSDGTKLTQNNANFFWDNTNNKLFTPYVIGGTATTSDLFLQTTSGVGATGADMHFLVGNNGSKEAMIITNKGNVGMNISTPGFLNGVDFTSAISFHLQYTTLSTASYSAISGGTSVNGLIISQDNAIADSRLWVLGSQINGTSSKYILSAYNDTGATETNLITVLRSGNIGFGATSPGSKLTIKAASDTAATIQIQNTDGTIAAELRTGADINSLFIGTNAGVSASGNAFNNTVIGAFALAGALSGNAHDNVAIGYNSLNTNTSGFSNVAIGSNALKANLTGSNNVAIGINALKAADTTTDSVAIGGGALAANTSGNYNVAIGGSSLNINTTGTRNFALGSNVLLNNNGSRNQGIGVNSLNRNTTGTDNIGFGDNAGGNNQTGSGNTTLGGGANSAADLTQATNSYSNDTCIGYRAGYVISTGSNNILLGYKAGDALTTGSNNIAIGYDIDLPSATASNQLSIGNLIFATGVDGTGTTISTGNVGIGTASPSQLLTVSSGANPRLAIDGTTDARLFFNTSGAIKWQIGTGISGTNELGIYDQVGGVERLHITTNGNVGIGTAGPNAAALLDVSSTTKGFLPPRMTTTQRDAISTPPAGLMIYNTTTNKLNFYNGTAWEAVTSA